METKRLYRSETNRHIAGVCGGIAEYFDIDPSLVRLAFLLGTVLGGPGVAIYVVMWIIVPEESQLYEDKAKRKNDDITL